MSYLEYEDWLRIKLNESNPELSVLREFVSLVKQYLENPDDYDCLLDTVIEYADRFIDRWD